MSHSNLLYSIIRFTNNVLKIDLFTKTFKLILARRHKEGF